MRETITQFSALGVEDPMAGRRHAGQEADLDLQSFIADHALRVEAVDPSHPAWGEVMQSIFRNGDDQSLLLHENGRLSARQTVLAAFSREQVVGHLCFRIEPARTSIGRMGVRAKLDSFAVEEPYTGTAVEKLLANHADERARLMKCRGPRVSALAVC